MNRLLASIKKGSFRWENYANGGYYCGLYITTMPLHCSYGQIGFVVTVDGKTEIRHDWELNETTVS